MFTIIAGLVIAAICAAHNRHADTTTERKAHEYPADEKNPNAFGRGTLVI